MSPHLEALQLLSQLVVRHHRFCQINLGVNELLSQIDQLRRHVIVESGLIAAPSRAIVRAGVGVGLLEFDHVHFKVGYFATKRRDGGEGFGVGRLVFRKLLLTITTQPTQQIIFTVRASRTHHVPSHHNTRFERTGEMENGGR